MEGKKTRPLGVIKLENGAVFYRGDDNILADVYSQSLKDRIYVEELTDTINSIVHHTGRIFIQELDDPDYCYVISSRPLDPTETEFIWDVLTDENWEEEWEKEDGVNDEMA